MHSICLSVKIFSAGGTEHSRLQRSASHQLPREADPPAHFWPHTAYPHHRESEGRAQSRQRSASPPIPLDSSRRSQSRRRSPPRRQASPSPHPDPRQTRQRFQSRTPARRSSPSPQLWPDRYVGVDADKDADRDADANHAGSLAERGARDRRERRDVSESPRHVDVRPKPALERRHPSQEGEQRRSAEHRGRQKQGQHLRDSEQHGRKRAPDVPHSKPSHKVRTPSVPVTATWA